MSKKKIFISGPMSNDPHYKKKFKKAAERFSAAGYYEPVSALTLKYKKDATYKECIDADLKALSECDAIFMLLGWALSKSAYLEHTYASTVGIPIFYEKDYANMYEEGGNE